MNDRVPYLGSDRPVAERVTDLPSRMRTEEKVDQMMLVNSAVDLEEDVLRKHAGSILHPSAERLAKAHETPDLNIKNWLCSTPRRSGLHKRQEWRR